MGLTIVQYKNMQQKALYSRQNNKITQLIWSKYIYTFPEKVLTGPKQGPNSKSKIETDRSAINRSALYKSIELLIDL